MSYYVEYNPELHMKYPSVGNGNNKMKRFKILFALMILIGGGCYFRNEIIDIIVPGDNAVTVSAVSSLVENVKAGEPVYESLVTFCEEIIVNAA